MDTGVNFSIQCIKDEADSIISCQIKAGNIYTPKAPPPLAMPLLPSCGNANGSHPPAKHVRTQSQLAAAQLEQHVRDVTVSPRDSYGQHRSEFDARIHVPPPNIGIMATVSRRPRTSCSRRS